MDLSTVFRETVFKPILFCGKPIEGAEGFKWPQFSAQRVPMIHFFIICLSGLRLFFWGVGRALAFECSALCLLNILKCRDKSYIRFLKWT